MFNVYNQFKSNRRNKPPQNFIPQSHFMFARTDPTSGVPFDEPPSFKPFARKLARTLGNLLLIVMLVLLATASVGKPAWAGGEPSVSVFDQLRHNKLAAGEWKYVLILMAPLNRHDQYDATMPVFWPFSTVADCNAAKVAIMFHYQNTRWDAVCVKQ